MEPITNLCYDVKELKKNGELVKLAKFLFLNIFLVTLDVILDIKTSIHFFEDGEPHWGTLNVVFIFNPSMFMLVTCFIKEFNKGTINALREALKKAAFCLPIIQTFRAIWRLHQMRKQAVFLTNAVNLHSIKKENAEAAIFEGFLEAAPCQILNLHILLLTGSITETQVASICTSIITLTLTAERVYFLYRTQEEEDVDPSWRLQLLVFPCMLLNTISSTILWSVLSANFNVWILLCTPFVFFTNLTCLEIYNTFKGFKQGFKDTVPVSLFASWLPSPLGTANNMLGYLAASSYVSKLALISVIWLLRWLNVSYLPHPPLTTCAHTNYSSSMSYCYSITNCFCGFQCDNKKQKIRYLMIL